MLSKTLKINKKGMVTIPVKIREKFGIKEGSEVSIMVINGVIQIIPIVNFEKLRKNFPSRNEMKKIYEMSKAEELELENEK